MNFRRNILILSIFIIFIFACGAFSASDFGNNQDIDVTTDFSNQSDAFGCCSIVIQLEGNHTLMSYRRDSNITADVFIEEVNWHGIPAIKQYKTEGGYFNHVIVTHDGWMIGLGGIDDGEDNRICEDITAEMINDNNTISESHLKEIQDIKTKYGKGHVVVKAPNGNYGFATPTKLKTGTLVPGQYISIPNDYMLSRGGNISLGIDDKINAITELARSDLYGLERREIVIYDFNTGENVNTTDIYISNEDGFYVGVDNSVYIDNVQFNNTTIKGTDIPVAPDYEKIGSVTFEDENSNVDNLIVLIAIVAFVVFVAILFYAVLRFVKFIKFHIRR